MTTVEENTALETGQQLPLMEHFYTIQGEGAQTGRAAYFLRLGGCDVGCVWCDVKESWPADAHPLVNIQEMVTAASVTSTEIVVITGGEPAMYNLQPLTTLLKKSGLLPCIETSGAYPLTGEWHWICFSPKKFKAPHDSVYAQANELKVVIYNRHDFAWAEQHAALVGPDCQLYLQPEWDRKEEMMPLIVDYVKENPQWQISLQTHKYLNVP